jgi:hypothetical protein
VYLTVPGDAEDLDGVYADFVENPYSKVNDDGYNLHITTNYRVLVENNWLYALDYQCEPTEHHEKRVTVKFICDRGVSHEFVRHRTMSFAQESTRYCNYCKSKFNNELIFIIPEWVQYIDEGDAYWHDGICFRTGASTDNMYMGSRSWTKPQPGDDADTWHIEEMFINSLYRIEVDYKNLIINAAQGLEDNKEAINDLNVFPVPDGDTGSNMSLTVGEAAKVLGKASDGDLDDTANEAAKAMLHGARGNSGVITSLIFRGIAQVLKGVHSCDGITLARALTNGAELAYSAVDKPAKGTI